MNIDDVFELLGLHRLVPVVTIDDASDAPGLGHALVAGGLPLAEITFRTAAAPAAIAALRAAVPDIRVGAGTVLDPATVDLAVASGAEFIVTPGFNPAVVDRCLETGVPIVPGVSTATEIEMARSRGLRLMKFFPAEAAGGLRMIQAVSAPYRDVRFMPTGGITTGNLTDYLRHGSVLACGGTWLATADAISGQQFDHISHTVAEAVAIVVAASAGESPTTSASQARRPVQPTDK